MWMHDQGHSGHCHMWNGAFACSGHVCWHFSQEVTMWSRWILKFGHQTYPLVSCFILVYPGWPSWRTFRIVFELVVRRQPSDPTIYILQNDSIPLCFCSQLLADDSNLPSISTSWSALNKTVFFAVIYFISWLVTGDKDNCLLNSKISPGSGTELGHKVRAQCCMHPNAIKTTALVSQKSHLTGWW